MQICQDDSHDYKTDSEAKDLTVAIRTGKLTKKCSRAISTSSLPTLHSLDTLHDQLLDSLIPSEQEIEQLRQQTIERVEHQIKMEALQHKWKIEELQNRLTRVTEKLTPSARAMITNNQRDILSVVLGATENSMDPKTRSISFTNPKLQDTDLHQQLSTQELQQRIEMEGFQHAQEMKRLLAQQDVD